jgi:hypothetical protein
MKIFNNNNPLKFNSKRSFSTSAINNNKNNKLSLYFDNSKSKAILDRINGIYKIYDKLYLNRETVYNKSDVNKIRSSIDKFTYSLTQILEDLYDNNQHTLFNLYFLIKPDLNKGIKFDLIKLNQHFNNYPLEFLNNNIVQIYKNTGLLGVNGILVFFPFYDITNLFKIS